LSEVVARAEDDIDSMLEKSGNGHVDGDYPGVFYQFPYLNPNWAKNAKKKGFWASRSRARWTLLSCHHGIGESIQVRALKVAKKASEIMGIPMPAAITCVKPSGTVSQLVDSASGLHPRFAKHYIRRYRIAASDPLFRMVRDQGVPASPENGQRKQDYVKAVRVYDAAQDKVQGLMQAKSICPIFDPRAGVRIR